MSYSTDKAALIADQLRRLATQRSNQYLVKPFLGEALIEAVNRSLSHE